MALLHLSLRLPLYFQCQFFGHFSPDNYDLVGVRGADGGVGAWGGRGRKGGGGVGVGWGSGFYSETANPPIKRVLFNNAGQFPEVGLTPPLFYKEMIFHTQTSLIGCSRGGERALEDMKMVSFSFLLRFGTPPPLLLSFLKSNFNFKDAFSSSNLICKSNRVLCMI